MGRFSADAENLSTSLAAYCSSSARPRNFCCSAFASYRAKVCSHADCALGGDRLAPAAKHTYVTLKTDSIPKLLVRKPQGFSLQTRHTKSVRLVRPVRLVRQSAAPYACTPQMVSRALLVRKPLGVVCNLRRSNTLRTHPYRSVLIRIGQSVHPRRHRKWGVCRHTRNGLQAAPLLMPALACSPQGGAACTDRYGKVRRFYLARRITPYRSVPIRTHPYP